jgi:hypothetical protein
MEACGEEDKGVGPRMFAGGTGELESQTWNDKQMLTEYMRGANGGLRAWAAVIRCSSSG